ncbi:LysR family transcriptional regulator [Burkholderia pyrrocinia]|uniref:LysR family transcriptional regulator n=1 Tax=Burkholderia pyrrocinia TaxID=60550 RepID=UPI0037DC53EE
MARRLRRTRAAENRIVTHPAFGCRIRSLEEWGGTRLIARTKPFELTAAGTVFLDAASNALDIPDGAHAIAGRVAGAGEPPPDRDRPHALGDVLSRLVRRDGCARRLLHGDRCRPAARRR